jgi:hypothetical protein
MTDKHLPRFACFHQCYLSWASLGRLGPQAGAERMLAPQPFRETTIRVSTGCHHGCPDQHLLCTDFHVGAEWPDVRLLATEQFANYPHERHGGNSRAAPPHSRDEVIACEICACDNRSLVSGIRER